MLTQQDFATMLLRGRVTLANTLKDILAKEYKGYEPGSWGQAVCLKLKLAGLTFSILISDYISADAVASYYGVSELISGEFGVPTTDPNAQIGNSISITNPVQKPKPPATEIHYNDTKWDANHLVYTDITWSGFVPQIYINGQRFLQIGTEFTSLPTGGFTLASPLIDGDILYVIF